MSGSSIMNVAVLGGGLQGCCIALALAERGVRVTIYDRNDTLLSRAAIANEGKIHLGYMYAGDPTLSTAHMMVRGALTFAPFMMRYVGLSPERIQISKPAVYLVHRDSDRTLEDIAAHMTAVHGIVVEAAHGRMDAYFGADLNRPPRVWSAVERDDWFEPLIAVAAFDTQELSIEPISLAAAVRERIVTEPRIEVKLNQFVTSVEEDGAGIAVRLDGHAGPERRRFDHVVNALWDGRLAIDATFGLSPGRPWLHRLRYGVTLRTPAAVRRPPTTTIIHGPFGEVANHGDGLMALMWYPSCLGGVSSEIAPPDWPMYLDEPVKSKLFADTFEALAAVIPALRQLDLGQITDLSVKGGVIVAWGQTDINDPHSELHRRFEIGVTSTGRYHSVDPGKLTMVPYFAEVCADRIVDRS